MSCIYHVIVIINKSSFDRSVSGVRPGSYLVSFRSPSVGCVFPYYIHITYFGNIYYILITTYYIPYYILAPGSFGSRTRRDQVGN
jgi:hypothetical protein